MPKRIWKVSHPASLVDHNRKYIDPQGGIYAISMDDQIMIKRVHLLHPLRKIRIISDNDKYEIIETDLEQIVVSGKIIWYGRKLER